MGWRDAPLVDGQAAGAPAWASAPLVREAAPDAAAAKRALAEQTGAGEAFTVGAGKMGSELYEGGKKSLGGIAAIMSELLPERLKRAAQEEISKRLLAQEQRIQKEGGAKEYQALAEAHPIATTAGEVAPLIAAPMLRVAQGPGAGAAAINAVASAAVPAAVQYGTPEEAMQRTALAAGGAGVGSGVASGVGKVLRGVTNALTPETRRLVALAESKFDIPLDASQKTGSKALQTVDAVMDSMPVTSGTQAARKGAQKTAFTREVMKTLGENVDEATPATLAAASGRIGGDFERIFSKVKVNLDDEGVQGSIGKVLQEAFDQLTPDQARIVAKRAAEILDKIDDKGAVPGKAYQAWRTSVQQQVKATKNEWLGTQLRNLYRAVDDAAYKSAAEVSEDAALQTARGQYRNMKIIEPLIAKSEDGTISPKLLRQLVMNANKDFAKGGGGDLAELAKIGHKLVADQVPTSGSSERILAQNLLTAGAVGGGTFALTDDPQKAIGYGIGALALPKAVQAAIGSRAGQKYLTQGARQLSPLEQALLDRAARAGFLGLAQQAGE